MISPSGTLLIFSRPLVNGQTKSRLVPAYGVAGATALAKGFLLDTYALACRADVARTIVCVAAPGALPEFQPPARIWPQGPGDLGDRMTRMAKRALLLDPSFVIIIGSDSPGLPPEFLEKAVRALRGGAAAVLGPADDGGYYLLGLNRCPADLLAKLEWSRNNTASLTTQRLAEFELDPHILPQWFDVDLPRDVERLRDLITRGRVSAPHTSELLQHIVESREDQRYHPDTE
jgi:rSAM/selenodomain-associated transferase 1